MGIKPEVVGIVCNLFGEVVTEWKLRNEKTKRKRDQVTFTLILLKTFCIALFCLHSVMTYICKWTLSMFKPVLRKKITTDWFEKGKYTEYF